MRELSPGEKAFLEKSVGNRESFEHRPRGVKLRLVSLLGFLLRYIPLTIGFFTLVLACLVTYLNFWIQDYFGTDSLKNMKEMEASGTLALADPQAEIWIIEILKIYEVIPWVIFGLFTFGAILMGLSIMLLGRNKNV